MSSSKDISQALSNLGRRLIQIGYVSLAQMQQAAAATRTGKPLIEILQDITRRPIPLDLINQHTKQHPYIIKALYGVEFTSLETISSQDIFRLINELVPIAFCRRYQLLPIAQANPHVLTVVMVEPNNEQTKQELESLLTSHKIKPQYSGISTEDYIELLNKYNEQNRIFQPERAIDETLINVGERIDEILDADLEEEEQPSPQRNLSSEESAIVTLVEKILDEGIEKKATQIEIEPTNNSGSIEYEEDGIFYPRSEGPLSLELMPAVISYLKKLANLETTSSTQIQQGRIRFRFNGRPVEFWLTSSPGKYGEKISLRLLNQSIILNLAELVTDATTLQNILNLLEQRSGLIIVTGNNRLSIINTLYSLLSQTNQPQVKIITVEEPVERIIPGLTQLEVERLRKNDHASILRAIPPQEVDLMMVDDLPDAMTAKIVVEMASQGRLVLVGLATQDCSEGITRLLAQNIAPSLIAEQLLGVIHHRYLRCLCPVCRLSNSPTPGQVAQFGLSTKSIEKIDFYKANTLSREGIIQAQSKGRLCRNCNGLGYRGQIGVYEVLKVTPSLKRVIGQNPSPEFLAKAVEEENTKSSISYALEQTYQGLTTLEEIERVFGDQLEEHSQVVPLAKKTTSSPLIDQRIENIESLLMGLLHEFQQLKQAVKPAEETTLNQIKEEFLEDGYQDLDPAKQTIASQSAFYEELVDPGEWDQLRNELDIDKETIAADFSEDDLKPFRKSSPGSLPDPW